MTLITERLAEEGFPGVRAAYKSVLMPLFEQDGLRVGEIGERSRLSKQSMTRLLAQCEADGLVRRRPRRLAATTTTRSGER